MGQGAGALGGGGGAGGGAGGPPGEKRKYEPPPPPTIGKKKRRKRGAEAAVRLPVVTPVTRCRLRLFKLERTADWLRLEEEFLGGQRAREELLHGTASAAPAAAAAAAGGADGKPAKAAPTAGTSSADDEAAEAAGFLIKKTTVLGQSVAEANRAKVEELRGSPLEVGSLEEIIDDQHAIISQSGGASSEYYVTIASFVDKDSLELGSKVLLHHRVHAIVGLLQDDADPMVSVMKVDKAPLETYADVGGLEKQIQEIKEAVELPLTHPELYEEIGIKPPKCVILYGEPGTGKTLLAKAVANQTSATFLRVVGSELIQKYLGEGPRLVRELFRVADELAPSIVFIDEVDAIGTKRYDSSSGGEREIQRTMLELLNQLDGFDERGDIKVLMATNRIDSLDPALIRPGRIDRKIEFPMPDIKTKRHIFKIHTGRMKLGDDVDLEEFVMSKNDVSGADIKAICTEAGLLALRERRMRVVQSDFKKARDKVLYRKREGQHAEGMYL